MGLVGMSRKKKVKNIYLLKMNLWCKLVGRCKHRYASMTP